MALGVEPFEWNFCPICGLDLAGAHDGESERPHCAQCRRFYYSNPVPAACCIVTRGDDLLLAKRAVEPCRGQWALPGGFVEIHETTEEAALRELKEETGIEGGDLTLIGVSTHKSAMQGAVTVLGYHVGSWKGEPIPGSDVVEVAFYPKSQRPQIPFAAHRNLLQIYDKQQAARNGI